MEFNYKKGINFGLWLSQYQKYDEEHFANYNTEKDFELVAKLGFDHVRLPVDYPIIEDDDNPFVYKQKGLSYIDNAINWATKHGLKIILDLHRAPGYFFGENKNNLLTDTFAQKRFVGIWQFFAKRYLDYGEELAFELLNEIKDDTKSKNWNKLIAKSVKAIRKIDKNRIIVVGGNYMNSAGALSELKPIKDKNVVYTFHMYSPIIFTHQKASWMETHRKMQYQVTYPNTKEQYTKWEVMLDPNNPRTHEADIDKDYLRAHIMPAVEFAKKHKVPVYCGEFGVISHAPKDSTKRWLTDMVDLFNEYNIGRAVWDYKEGQFLFTYRDDTKDLFKIILR